MAIDFPASPTLNDVFTVGNVAYVWDGTKWTASVTGGISLDKIEEGNTSAEVIDTGSDGRFVVTTEGTERLRIDSAGRVGIGNSIPGTFNPFANNLVIGSGSGNAGLTCYSGSNSAGVINFADGTSGSDLFSGYIYYNHFNDNLGFYVNYAGSNQPRLFIDSNGRVGIGTTSPGATLDSAGDVRLSLENSQSRTLSFHNTSSNTTYATINYEDVSGRLTLSDSYGIAFNTVAGGGAASNATEAARIDNSGRLLVGTSTSRSAGDVAAQIHLEGTTYNAASLNLISNPGAVVGGVAHITLAKSRSSTVGGTDVVANGDSLGHIQWAGADGTDLNSVAAQIRAEVDGAPGANDMPGRIVLSTTADGASNPTERMRISSNGNVGIGSDAPDSRFVIRSHSGVSNTPIFKIEHPSNDADFAISGLYDTDGNITYLGSNLYYNSSYAVARFDTGKPSSGISLSGRTGNGEISFLTGTATATERMRITNSGYTIHHAPGWVLEVATAAASGTTDRLIYGVSERAAAGAGGGNQVFIVYSNGNVVNFNNSYGSISDIKLKENIVDAHSQWDDLKALQVRNYNFKEGQTHTQIGLVAQEVELVSPGLVSESPDRDEDGNDLGTVTKSVNYSVLYMKAVKALQEAMERIETLEGMVAVNNITIDEQQHQLSTLAARLTALESA
jgi:hypothetical protein